MTRARDVLRWMAYATLYGPKVEKAVRDRKGMERFRLRARARGVTTSELGVMTTALHEGDVDFLTFQDFGGQSDYATWGDLFAACESERTLAAAIGLRDELNG